MSATPIPMIDAPFSTWVIFNLFIATLLILDLVVLNNKNKEMSFKQALLLSGFWISLALIFNVGIYFWYGKEKALEFLAGYVVEESLSIDNLFVFLLIFSYFKVPQQYQRKVLTWGIFGAVIMRAIFILAGAALLERFHWLMYIFGSFLVFSGIKLFFESEKEINPMDSVVIKTFKKFFKVTSDYHGNRFWVKEAGKWVATPLFIVLIVIETTDLIFAVDSIPAVLAITKDPFIVYSSNIFAVLGLRALYFALAGLMSLFHLLHYGLGVVLVFVGAKMLSESFIHIPIVVSLGVIVVVLATSIVLSLFIPCKKKICDLKKES